MAAHSTRWSSVPTTVARIGCRYNSINVETPRPRRQRSSVVGLPRTLFLGIQGRMNCRRAAGYVAGVASLAEAAAEAEAAVAAAAAAAMWVKYQGRIRDAAVAPPPWHRGSGNGGGGRGRAVVADKGRRRRATPTAPTRTPPPPQMEGTTRASKLVAIASVAAKLRVMSRSPNQDSGFAIRLPGRAEVTRIRIT